MKRCLILSVISLCLTSLGLAGTPRPMQSQSATAPSVEEQAKAVLGLRAARIGDLHVVADLDDRLIVGLDVPGAAVFLDLTPHSVRSNKYAVRAQLDDGTWIDVDPEPAGTYRGVVVDDPGSRVAASWLVDGLHARIFASDGSEHWIEPLSGRVPTATWKQHALYGNEDALDAGRTCASDLIAQPGAPTLGGSAQTGSDTRASGGGLKAMTVAEIACDSDYEYYQDWGSVSGVTNRIESVINTVNLQYESDVSISHAITTILVRTSPNDPYTKKPAEQLLYQFRNEWNANQTGTPRDVAHLFTGRNLSGSTIGIAWISVVCNLDLAYSLVESDFSSAFAATTDLTAHELGHNWGAGHCSCTNYTMNSYITAANQFSPSATIPDITAYKDSVSCFGPVDPPQDPTSIHVDSISAGTASAGKGKKHGTATISIVTDVGGAEAGATVSGAFSGDFNESVSGVTNGSGSVSFTTTASIKGKSNFTFCVTNVSGSLPYVSGDNVETCDSN